ncbi:anosmin-1 [Orussus abietinus]|uniref:anosmin-1 n=1 Tax=Orussus abietinus TaxID=222816 RepID=UPI00062621DE|nr:anosmin-1 [Orussus abietinus]
MFLIWGLSLLHTPCASTTTGYQPPGSVKKWWPWWLLLPGCLASWTRYVEEYDSMRVARCDARCGENHPDECMESCLSANYTKPGYCPSSRSMSAFEAACLVACEGDSKCPDLAKCCPHECGITCMHPTGLDERTDLPPVPETIQIRQQTTNLVMLNWQAPPHPSNISVRYLVEERHLLGPRYLESRLSSWSVRHVSTKPHASLRGGLKTGHWYQFRVAAINENGSRGYSRPSRPFKTKEPRNPKEPQSLTLSGARVAAGKLRVNLRWRPPPSDVPIMFYKVFWSRLIHGPNNDSILVYHRTVPKDKMCYELKNLELSCQYFLQVQAVALYGGRRLASRKASKVFNSTDYTKFAEGGRRSRRCERHQGGLHVRRMICQCGEITARLVWPPSVDAKRYNVSWRQESCSTSRGTRNPDFHRKTSSRITEAPHYDIRQLKYDCTYVVNVRNVPHQGKIEEHGTSIEFLATGCHQSRTGEKKQKQPQDKLTQCKSKPSRIRRHYI